MARESRTIQASGGTQGRRPEVPGRPEVRQRRMPPERRRRVLARRASRDSQMNLGRRCATGGPPVVRPRRRTIRGARAGQGRRGGRPVVRDRGVIRGGLVVRELRAVRVARGRRGCRTASRPGRALAVERNRKPGWAQDRPDIRGAVLGVGRPVLGRQELRRLAPTYRRAGPGPEELRVATLGSAVPAAERPESGCACPAFCLASRMSWEHGRGDPHSPGCGGRSAAGTGARVWRRGQPSGCSGRYRTRRRAGRRSPPARRAGRRSPGSRWPQGRSGPRRPGLGGGRQPSGSG